MRPLRTAIGVAALEPADDLARLVARAGAALYASKRDGRVADGDAVLVGREC